jgi:hypothetical protein
LFDIVVPDENRTGRSSSIERLKGQWPGLDHWRTDMHIHADGTREARPADTRMGLSLN